MVFLFDLVIICCYSWLIAKWLKIPKYFIPAIGILLWTSKAITLGLILWSLGYWTRDVIFWASIGCNVIATLSLVKYRSQRKLFTTWLQTFQLRFISMGYIFILFFLGILIFNVIPFAGDELMYHLPLTIEMLKHGSFFGDLWLTQYWSANLTETYPKNLYFLLGYFASIFRDPMLGLQWYAVTVFTWFICVLWLLTSRVIHLFTPYITKGVTQWERYLVVLSLISIPVIYLQAFLKVDLIFHALILLLVIVAIEITSIHPHKKFNQQQGIFLSVFTCLILGFKFTAVFPVFIIGILLLIVGARTKQLSTEFFSGLVIGLILGLPLLGAYVINMYEHGHPFFPANINNFESFNFNQSLKLIPRFFLDFFYSDVANFWRITDLSLLPQFHNPSLFNYDRGFGYAWIFLILCVLISGYQYRKSWITLIIVLFILLYLWLGLININLLFWHRYGLYFYICIFLFWLMSIFILKNIKVRCTLLVTLILINFYSVLPGIGSYGQNASGLVQSVVWLTTNNLCQKIRILGDISRHDYRRTWEFICNNRQNTNILAIHQIWTYYLYGRDWSNTLTNAIFIKKSDFLETLEKKQISTVITSNKNNLYAKMGIRDQIMYSTTHDSSDESIAFCTPDSAYRISWTNKVWMKYAIDRPKDSKYALLVNHWEDGIYLDPNKETLDWVPNVRDVSSLCIVMMHTPTVSFDRKEKVIHVPSIVLTGPDDQTQEIPLSDFRFYPYSFEDVWLTEEGWKIIIEDNYENLDIARTWEKP